MIQLDDIKKGNWISKNLSGSLLESYKVLEVQNLGVIIEDGEPNKFLKIDNMWKYSEVQLDGLSIISDIKGIPITTPILERCGFKLRSKTAPLPQPSAEGFNVQYYSNPDLFTLIYVAGTPEKFTHEESNLDIKFVHQLQNVYQVVMNKPLEINISRYNYQLLSSK